MELICSSCSLLYSSSSSSCSSSSSSSAFAKFQLKWIGVAEGGWGKDDFGIVDGVEGRWARKEGQMNFWAKAELHSSGEPEGGGVDDDEEEEEEHGDGGGHPREKKNRFAIKQDIWHGVHWSRGESTDWA